MTEIKEIIDQKIWEEFILAQPESSFFQSWNWGEVQRGVWRLGVYDKDELVGVAQVVKITAKKGSYLQVRHGPILKEWKPVYLDALFKYLKKLGKEEKVWFLRMSPLLGKTVAQQNFFKERGFQEVVIPRLDASLAWVLDITKSEEDLLLEMRKTTRYLIHKAQKMGVKVFEGTKESDLQAFLNIYQTTAQRQHFVPHSGIKEEFLILGKAGQVKLLLAEYQEKIMAGALIVFYGKQAVYHHSGAILDSNIPAMYLLLWKAILEAKKENKSIFNFWGISPQDKPSDPWSGLTLFKTGFGGKTKEFLPAHDLPLSPFYSLTRLVETFWKMKRGY